MAIDINYNSKSFFVSKLIDFINSSAYRPCLSVLTLSYYGIVIRIYRP